MEEEQAQGDSGASPAGGAPKKQRSGRPDFTLRKFEVFAGVFNVAELKALNDAQKFRHSTFQAKAAELHERATGEKKAAGFFKSWDQIIDTILKHATSTHHADGAAGGADGAEGEVDVPVVEEDGDAEVAEALLVVERMLSGDEFDEEFVKSLTRESGRGWAWVVLGWTRVDRGWFSFYIVHLVEIRNHPVPPGTTHRYTYTTTYTTREG